MRDRREERDRERRERRRERRRAREAAERRHDELKEAWRLRREEDPTGRNRKGRPG